MNTLENSLEPFWTALFQLFVFNFFYFYKLLICVMKAISRNIPEHVIMWEFHFFISFLYQQRMIRMCYVLCYVLKFQLNER